MTSALLHWCPTYPNNSVLIKESLSNYKSAVMKHFPLFRPGRCNIREALPKTASASAHLPGSLLTHVRSRSFHLIGRRHEKKKKKKKLFQIRAVIANLGGFQIFQNYDISHFMENVIRLSAESADRGNLRRGFQRSASISAILQLCFL